jgi:predicted amidohydrolase
MKAGFYQFDPLFGDIQGNVKKVIDAVSDRKFDLIVLPELFNSGYQFTSHDEVRSLSEEIPDGFTTRQMAALSGSLHSYIVFGLPEHDSGNYFNSAVLTGPDGFIGSYRKIHLFYEENLWFTPGDGGFKVWETPIGKIGIMVCFDWFFPESARILSLMGADIIAHPSNLVLPYCPNGMPTRCLENSVFAVTANRTGSEKRYADKEALDFIGSSQITGTRGEIIFRAPEREDSLFITELDLERARTKNFNPFNNIFKDRKTKFYSLLTDNDAQDS